MQNYRKYSKFLVYHYYLSINIYIMIIHQLFINYYLSLLFVAKMENDEQFSILATARSSFHLSVLEVTYINSLQPILCCQKEFVYSLQISH